MIHYDVAVIGAGPAGSTAARGLAAAGLHTALIERERLPRYKSCAGGIPARTARQLPFSIEPVIEDRVSVIDVSYFGRPQFVQHGAEAFAYMVMRDRFDQVLASEAARAGARLIEGCAVRSIEDCSNHFRLMTEAGPLHADFVVGADGANSLVARTSGLGRGLSEAAALEAEVAAPRAALARWRAAVNIDLGYRPSGYGWVFPKQRLLSVGVVRPRGQARRLRDELARYLGRLDLDGASVERLVGHKVLFRRGNEPIAGDGTLLTGDAAGLVDEFTEEGIFYAIRSGGLAALAIRESLAAGRRDLRAYERAVDRELMPELRAARTIAALFYGTLRRAPVVMLELSRRVGYFWRAFFRVQRGESSYDEEVRRARLIAPLDRLFVP
jgi:geranylgeranyl reductase family protein